jgi:CheY-like chemotaxis protein
MSVSILVVDDEPDLALLFRQRFRREVREGAYVIHAANSGEEAINQLADEIEPELIAPLTPSQLALLERLVRERLEPIIDVEAGPEGQ